MTGTELRLKTDRVNAATKAAYDAMIDKQVNEILALCDEQAALGNSYLTTEKSYHSDALDKLALDKTLTVKRPAETRHGDLIVSW